MTSRRKLFATAALVCILGALAAAAGWLAYDWHRPYKGYEGALTLSVQRGEPAGEVLEDLAARGVVKHRLSLKLAYSFMRRGMTIKAGRYSFDRPMSPLQVLDKLRKGEVVYVKVTLPEGLRIGEAAHLFSKEGLGSYPRFLEAMRDPSPIRDLDPQAKTLEGYLFPETYLVATGTDEDAIVRILVDKFRAWWKLNREPAPDGLDLRQIVTLASIVEKETANPTERPLIAGVFYNRLRKGMLLQSDPTVIYALVRDGRYRGVITRRDLHFESPYNTYVVKGLPPGPICSPGKASLSAALNPDRTGYLYFVSKGNGTHAFSKTLTEHNRAVAKYQLHSGGRR
jgi:UPF0755 protein